MSRHAAVGARTREELHAESTSRPTNEAPYDVPTRGPFLLACPARLDALKRKWTSYRTDI
jgi:hypothetical protein